MSFRKKYGIGMVLFWVVLIAIGLTFGTSSQDNYDCEVETMTVEFDGVDDLLTLAADSRFDNLEQLSISIWFRADDYGENELGRFLDKDNGNSDGWVLFLNNVAALGSPQWIEFSREDYTDGGAGTGVLWHIGGSSVVGDAGLHNLIITHDATAQLPDATIFYLDGVKTVGTVEASGILPWIGDDSGNVIRLGNRAAGDRTFDGLQGDYRLYNIILTDQEAADIWNSKGLDNIDRGLIYHCEAIGAAGLQTFDGATLGASNTLADLIAGVKATPSGSPVGRGNVAIS